jgi:hypothetical protein
LRSGKDLECKLYDYKVRSGEGRKEGRKEGRRTDSFCLIMASTYDIS